MEAKFSYGENMTRKEIIKTLVNDYGHNEFDLKANMKKI